MSNSTKTHLPYAGTAMAKFLDKRINDLRSVRTAAQIAKNLWLDDPKELDQLRRGEEKFPLDRLSLLTLAIDAAPAHVLRLALEQHWPDLQGAFVECFGALATPNEESILLRKWREATDNLDPDATPAIERVVDRMIADVKTVRSTP